MTRDIVINGRFLSRRVTGVERYGQEISRLIEGRPTLGRAEGCRVEKTRSNGLIGHVWEQFILPTKLKSESILWSPANTGPLMVRNQALTIHDLSPLEHPEWFRESFAVWYRLFLPTLAKKVRLIFAPSNYVKQKIERRFQVGNVIVTPNGADTSRFHPDARQTTYDLPDSYILFAGSLQPRKNLRSLLRVWREIRGEFPNLWLIIAGETGTVFGEIKFIADERVRFLGYITDEDLPGLYAKATLFVLPSLDEGFGLPAIEAMACGTPVIVSNGGALPETVADAGLVFELSKPDGLANAILECLNDGSLCLSLKEKGLVRAENFSWHKTADLIWNTLYEI